MAAEQPPREAAAQPPADRVPGGQLSEGEVVRAALRVAERVGFTGVSMREVARELDVTPMAIYYHVQNKQALLELVADVILAGIRLPPSDAGTWMERLRLLHQETNRVLGVYPGIDAMMIDLGLTAQGRRLMDANIQILLDAGFDERMALLAYNVLHSYGVGRVTIEARLRGRRRSLPGAVSGDYPALRRIRDQVPDLRAADYRAFGYEAILLGLDDLLKAARSHEEGSRSATP
ncbi:TetR family transcriptional regulator [Streptosporangium sp. NPDC002544]|uniref:TetR family transcriptional regulator n=1 Tax=Streptosporangium sp. NPDC002544 TaxID=3154538 RepID=UPI00331D8ED1